MNGIDSVVRQEAPALGVGSEQKVQHSSDESGLGAGGICASVYQCFTDAVESSSNREQGEQAADGAKT